jgi:diguanylate cyclase (GGDEF)-like protein
MEFNLFLRTLQRGWWIIILSIFIATTASLAISYITPPTYETTARYVVTPNAGLFSSGWELLSSLDTLDRRSIVNTYREMIASPAVYERSPEIQRIKQQFLDDFEVFVAVVPDTNILRLTVEGPDPRLVVVVANAISTEVLAYMNELSPVYSISILEAPQLPTAPIRPQPLENALLAVLFGGMVGLVLAFSREQLQNTLDKLRERSILDPVSSAYTRVYFERRLLEEIAQRPDGSFAMGIINLRGLEQVVNVLPEPIFNRVLGSVSKKLKNELRGRDIVGRWSETQLAVILPGTPETAVESTFKRLQVYLSEAVPVDDSGDMAFDPDPCIGVIMHKQLETGESIIERAQMAVEKASALSEASVVFLKNPYFSDESVDSTVVKTGTSN